MLFITPARLHRMTSAINVLSPNKERTVSLSNYYVGVMKNILSCVAESYQLYVPELAPVGKAVGQIRAADEDEGENADMTYSITNADAAAIFNITTDADRREGIISLKQV